MEIFKTNQVATTGWPNTSCHLSCQVLRPWHFSRPGSLSWTSQGYSQVNRNQMVAVLKKLGFSHKALNYSQFQIFISLETWSPCFVVSIVFYPRWRLTWRWVFPPPSKILDITVAFITASCGRLEGMLFEMVVGPLGEDAVRTLDKSGECVYKCIKQGPTWAITSLLLPLRNCVCVCVWPLFFFLPKISWL